MDITRAKTAISLLGATSAAIWGSMDMAVKVLVVLMVFDLLSGLVAAVGSPSRQGLDSTIGYLGWRRKANTILVVMAVAVLQTLALQDVPAISVVAGGFAGVEFFSIIENAAACGVRLPTPIASMFERLRPTLTGETPKESN